MPKLCSFGCAPSGVPMHRFPNADNFPDRFMDWVNLVGGKLETPVDTEYYQSKVVCDLHFTSRDKNRNSRLNALAVPSLNLNVVAQEKCSTQKKDCYESELKHDKSHLDMQPSTSQSDTETKLEVCIDSLESAFNAIQGGANEIEVCSSLMEGGLTPSPGLVKQIIELVKNRVECENLDIQEKPKVNIMIRCRGGSDFCYTEHEMDTMIADIKVYKDFGVDRFVFGALTDEQDIDKKNCTRVIETAYPIPVTFHRAFDLCREPNLAIQDIIKLGFSRVLTSGQRSSAADEKAQKLLKLLLDNYNDVIEIMPGAGVNCDNADIFVKSGFKIIHSSCKKAKLFPDIGSDLCMGSNEMYFTDENIVRKLKEIIKINHS